MADKEQTKPGFWEGGQDAPSTKVKQPTYDDAKKLSLKYGDYATAGLHRTRKTPYKRAAKSGSK
jgi:hypothetical protein